jgi:AraC-like DNA-binding protein
MVIYADYSTRELSPRDRFASWYELTRRSLIPTIVRSDHEDDFTATSRLVNLGGVQVSALNYPSVRIHRSAKLIKQEDPEQISLWFGLNGDLGLATAGREATVGYRDLVIYDTSLPFHASATAESGSVTGVVVQIPRTLLPLSAASLARLVAVPLSGRDGVGALFAQFLVDLTRHAPSYRPQDAARLATVTVDLLAAVCAHHLDIGPVLPGETRQRVLQLRIHDFITRHLGNPALSPRMIAAAHQISLRYLYQLFAEQGLTVAGWIRQRRLERCRRDLADPRLATSSIASIAARAGFTDAAHFSRLFRATHGMPPNEYRRLTRQPPF